jgi:RNA polymerase primary sigma factor
MVRSNIDLPIKKTRTPNSAALDPIKQYWKSIELCQPLSQEREAELARRGQAGDERAFDELVTANLRFVVSTALKYSGRGLSIPELVSEGNMGLIKAARRFDPEHNCKLITYAVWWIRESIHSALRRAKGATTLTASRLVDFKRLRREADDLSQELGIELSLQEASDRMGFDPDRTHELLNASMPDLSLDAPISERGAATWETQFAAEGDSAEDDLEREALEAVVRGSLEVLNEREEYIVRRYFGLDGKDAETLQEVGSALGVTRERARQLRNRALEKIRERHGDVLMDFAQN